MARPEGADTSECEGQEQHLTQNHLGWKDFIHTGKLVFNISFFPDNCSTVGAFRKANIMCMLAIQKSNKEELLDQGSEEAVLRHR